MVRNYGYENTVQVFTDVAGAPTNLAPRIRPGKSHLAVIERFVAAILDGGPRVPGPEEGLRRSEVLDACYRSSEIGQEIAF